VLHQPRRAPLNANTLYQLLENVIIAVVDGIAGNPRHHHGGRGSHRDAHGIAEDCVAADDIAAAGISEWARSIVI
jgi:hypothetical protein